MRERTRPPFSFPLGIEWTPLRRVLTVGTPANRLLRAGLAALTLVPTVYVFVQLARTVIIGNDFAIWLAAADRWLAGGDPYTSTGFGVAYGPDLPFLYPPFVLPFVAPLTLLPSEPVVLAFCGLCLAAAVFACLRLGIPAVFVPLVLMARPFSEGILAGNVQVILFAGFVLAFFAARDRAADWRPVPSDPADPRVSSRTPGVVSAGIAALKPTQPHAWMYLLLHRPRRAVVGGATVALVLVATLPFTGLGLWADWLDQLRLASWNGGPAGLAIASFAGWLPGVALFGASLVALRHVPRTQAGVWVGVATVLGALSLHGHVFTYLVPAWLVIRREVALVAALFGASLTARGLWAGAFIVIAAVFLSTVVPALREPAPGQPDPAPPAPSST
jgi:hypothetical protein